MPPGGPGGIPGRACGCIICGEGAPTPRAGPPRPAAGPDAWAGTPRPAARPTPGPPEAPGIGTRAIPSYNINNHLTLNTSAILVSVYFGKQRDYTKTSCWVSFNTLINYKGSGNRITNIFIKMTENTSAGGGPSTVMDTRFSPRSNTRPSALFSSFSAVLLFGLTRRNSSQSPRITFMCLSNALNVPVIQINQFTKMFSHNKIKMICLHKLLNRINFT